MVIPMADDKLTMEQLEERKTQKTMRTVARRASYYRENPHRFAEVLGFHLKLFQKILIYAMMHYDFFMFIAARSTGKTFLTSMFCVIRCILYPGTKIVVCSGTLKQANEVILKIQDELMKMSPLLCSEIQEIKIGNDPICRFKNDSWIKTRTSTQHARGARANLIVVDEFRLVDEKILNEVIRRFLGNERHPKYLDKRKYQHMQERNKEIYMSSAYFQSTWAYKKAQSYTVSFFDDKRKYFICGLPYQLLILENLRSRAQTEDEINEPDFDEISWLMEMECIWWSDTENGLFSHEAFTKRRKIQHAFLPLELYNDKNPVPKVKGNDKRILSVDVALMRSRARKKNDAAALFINDLIQTDDTSYKSNFVYCDTFEGMTTDDLGLTIMKWFYKYKCTDIVFDGSGVGISVFDFICKDQYDPETGETYTALNAINNEDFSTRCKVKDANKVVWIVNGSAAFNNDICLMLRSGIENNKINFLIGEMEADEILSKEKFYTKLTPLQQAMVKKPYINTTLASYELVKLRGEIVNNKLKVREVSGMRKDMYTSMAYNYWCACQLEYKLRPQTQDTQTLVQKLTIRKARY